MRRTVKSACFILLFAVLLIAADCSVWSVKEEPGSNFGAGAKPVNSDIAGSAKVGGTTAKFDAAGGDLKEAFLNQPAPEVWFKFPGEAQNNETRVELPEEAKTLLSGYWKTCLRQRFFTEIERAANAREHQELNTELFEVAAKTNDELQKISIPTPTGRRNISYEEARELIAFISASASEVTEQAKRQKS